MVGWLALYLIGCGPTAYDRAQAQGKTSDKPLVIMATASWCGPCRYFKKRVLPEPEVQAALEDVRFVMLDEAKHGARLRRLGVRAFPTFLVVNRDHKVVAMVRGAVPASTFVDFLRWGTPMWFTQEALEARLRDAEGPRIHIYAARYYALHGDLPKSGVHYGRALAALPEDDVSARATLAWEIALVGSSGQSVDVVARKAVALVDTYPDAPEAREAIEFALLSDTLNTVESGALADRALDLFWDRPATLNDFVYTLIAARLPDHALRAAQRQVELAPDDANAYDTLAEAHSAAGNRDAAVDAVDEALRLETASDSRQTYKANRIRYLEGTGSQIVEARRLRMVRVAKRYGIRP